MAETYGTAGKGELPGVNTIPKPKRIAKGRTFCFDVQCNKKRKHFNGAIYCSPYCFEIKENTKILQCCRYYKGGK